MRYSFSFMVSFLICIFGVVRGFYPSYTIFQKKSGMKKGFFPLFAWLARVDISIRLRTTTFRFINFNRSSEGECSILTRPFRGFRICVLELRATICRSGRIYRLFPFRSVVFSCNACLIFSFLSTANMSVSQGISRVPILIGGGIIS